MFREGEGGEGGGLGEIGLFREGGGVFRERGRGGGGEGVRLGRGERGRGRGGLGRRSGV